MTLITSQNLLQQIRDLSMNGDVFPYFFHTHPIGHIVQPPGGERDVQVAREQRTQQHFWWFFFQPWAKIVLKLVASS